MMCFLHIWPLVSFVTQLSVTAKRPDRIVHGKAKFFGKNIFAKPTTNDQT